ncbi:MAG: hypothetical protein J6A90_00035 [Clostridia bacterium]|nr:hypothetical protein [Clostridia bacterium]
MNKYVSPIIEIEEVEVGDIICDSNRLPTLPDLPDVGGIPGTEGGDGDGTGTGNGGETEIIPPQNLANNYFN